MADKEKFPNLRKSVWTSLAKKYNLTEDLDHPKFLQNSKRKTIEFSVEELTFQIQQLEKIFSEIVDLSEQDHANSRTAGRYRHLLVSIADLIVTLEENKPGH